MEKAQTFERNVRCINLGVVAQTLVGTLLFPVGVSSPKMAAISSSDETGLVGAPLPAKLT